MTTRLSQKMYNLPMEKWFAKLSFLNQFILIIIPIIGWIIEVGVRISALIRLHSKKHIAGLIIFVVLGGFWFLCFIDVFFLYFKEDLMLIE